MAKRLLEPGPSPARNVKKRGEGLLERVGKTIRTVRTARKMTLEQVALQASIDAGSLSRIERGRQGWTHTTLSQIASALGVPVTSLFERPAWAAADLDSFVVIPRYLLAANEAEEDGIPFPLSWLPRGVKHSALTWLEVNAPSVCQYLIDTSDLELVEGKLFGLLYIDGPRVRRVHRRFDGALRLAGPDLTGDASLDDTVPPDAIKSLRVLGRVVWKGHPL